MFAKILNTHLIKADNEKDSSLIPDKLVPFREFHFQS